MQMDHDDGGSLLGGLPGGGGTSATAITAPAEVPGRRLQSPQESGGEMHQQREDVAPMDTEGLQPPTGQGNPQDPAAGVVSAVAPAAPMACPIPGIRNCPGSGGSYSCPPLACSAPFRDDVSVGDALPSALFVFGNAARTSATSAPMDMESGTESYSGHCTQTSDQQTVNFPGFGPDLDPVPPHGPHWYEYPHGSWAFRNQVTWEWDDWGSAYAPTPKSRWAQEATRRRQRK